jgi:hypothetical protein
MNGIRLGLLFLYPFFGIDIEEKIHINGVYLHICVNIYFVSFFMDIGKLD